MRTPARHAGVVIGRLHDVGGDQFAGAALELHLALPLAFNLRTHRAGDDLVELQSGQILRRIAEPLGKALVDVAELAVDVGRVNAQGQEIQEVRNVLALLADDLGDRAERVAGGGKPDPDRVVGLLREREVVGGAAPVPSLPP